MHVPHRKLQGQRTNLLISLSAPNTEAASVSQILPEFGSRDEPPISGTEPILAGRLVSVFSKSDIH